jgi:hypothetical protein
MSTPNPPKLSGALHGSLKAKQLYLSEKEAHKAGAVKKNTAL